MARGKRPGGGRTGSNIVAIMQTLLVLMMLVVPNASGFIPSFVDWGFCSTVPLQEDFRPEKYCGWWWDVSITPNEYQIAARCINQKISWTGESLEAEMTGLDLSGEPASSRASMSMDTSLDPPDPAQMTVTGASVPTVPYQVIATDYTNYSCVYSCLQYPGFFGEFFWIYSRTPHLSQELRQICLDKFTESDIGISKLKEVEQGETCPYYPGLKEQLDYNTRIFNGDPTVDGCSTSKNGNVNEITDPLQATDEADGFTTSPSALALNEHHPSAAAAGGRIDQWLVGLLLLPTTMLMLSL